ncbi:FG-GAP repeat domain-containing protein [Nevskia soli]|uniref:FG-GAP repeat domain-containing protein n=1 Tax=Nevskia soli TaxID=418856 RepID=UPI0006910CF3|nr:VCBS repeat-containing protein [Nevskia soli]
MSHAAFGAARLIAAACVCALLAACGGSGGGDAAPASPPAGAHSLGLMRITISGIGGAQMTSRAELLSGTAGPQAHVALPTAIPAGLDVRQASASTVDIGTRGAGGERYFTVAYQVRNAQFCGTPGTCTAYTAASHNLTLVAANTTSNIANTAISAISLYDGSSDAATQALATSLLPTHGMEFDTGRGAGVMVQPGLESLQVFTEEEVGAIPRDPGATDLFPYGYVVSNVHTPGSRALPANPAANQWDGEVSFSFKLPLQSDPKQDPYSITMMFDVIDDANTRVTQSAEEQSFAGDIAANLRAATLGSVDLAVLGGRVAQTNVGDPICAVRTAGTAGAPTATLVNNAGVTAASAPYNVQGVSSTMPINAGFCVPMSTPSAATFAVSGSQSGLRTAAGPYSGSYGANALGNMLSFTPTQPFFPGEMVSYTLGGGLTGSDGAPLLQPFTGSYTVATGAAAAAGLPSATGAFAPLASPAVASASFNLATGDFDGDGRLDIAVASASAGTVSILLNNGSGGFALAGTPVAGANAWNLAVGDFNGDGHPDIAVVNQIQDDEGNRLDTISILLNNGSGGFSLRQTVNLGAGTSASGIAVGDFNGDGHPDLALGDFIPGATQFDGVSAVEILLNDGNGSFAVHGYGVAAEPGDSLAVGDFNGDGTLDVAEVGQGSGVTVLFNDGKGNLGGAASFATGESPRGVVAADFNGDGKLDLAAANLSDGTVSILLGDGKGGFAPQVSISEGLSGSPWPRAITTGDFNNDGYPDLAVANLMNSSASIFLNNGHGGFTVSSNPTVGSNAEGVVTGDFDGDGRLDLAFQLFGGTVKVLGGQH